MSKARYRAAYFNMPHTSSERDFNAHKRITCDLLEAFGGYTDYPVRGAWRDTNDPCHVIRDPNQVRYEVAYDCSDMMTRESNFEKLRMIALIAGVSLKQKSVYIVDPNGFAHIEECLI
jgi:hypothetical protein